MTKCLEESGYLMIILDVDDSARLFYKERTTNSLKNVGDADQDAGKDGFIDELDITDTEDGKTLRTSSPFFKVYYRCFI